MLRRALSVFTVFSVVLLFGCGNGPTGTPPTTTSTPVLSISPSSTLTFPSTTVGQTSASQTFTFTNTGSAPLTLGSYVVSGATTSFVQTSGGTCGTTTTLVSNQSCTLAFAFAPQSTGTLTETIVATDNTANPTVTLSLTGSGTAASVPQASLAPNLTFQPTNAGSTATAQPVTLTNSGNAALSIANSVISGAGASAFMVTSTTCAATLAASSSCIYTISFTPTAASTTYSATLTVTDNSGNVTGSTQSVSLTGAGAASTATALAVLNPSSLSFGLVNLGTAATPESVTLSNPGGATLTGIAIAIVGTGASAFGETTTCGTTLSASTSCTITVSFMPGATGAYTATLSVSDSATGSPQTVALTGTGAAAQAVLSASSIIFPNTTINTTSASQSVTLSNPGNATLTGIVIGSPSGTGAANFADTTTCGTTLVAAGSCTISATFSPTTTNPYAASISVASSATGTPQTIALSGTGITASTIYHTLYVFPETDNSATPLYALVNGATKTIDMTMYALQDNTFTNDLVTACKRGVIVRVVLDQNNEKSNDTPNFNTLNAQTGCTAVWANKAFQVTHEKCFIVDGATVAIMSLNLQSQYYSTTRDYALVENDATDIAAIQATFNMDFAAGTTASGTVGASDYSYMPGNGDQPVAGTAYGLIWSPTTAHADMLSLINNATKTLLVENEEMSATDIAAALAAAATRGVSVTLIGEYSSSYVTNYSTIKNAGGNVYYYSSSTGFYVHGKAVVADLGLSTQAVYMGSINYSTASMTQNRELGVYINDQSNSNAIAKTIAATIVADESQTGVTHY